MNQQPCIRTVSIYVYTITSHVCLLQSSSSISTSWRRVAGVIEPKLPANKTNPGTGPSPVSRTIHPFSRRFKSIPSKSIIASKHPEPNNAVHPLLNMYHVELIPNSTTTHATPGWTYVPDRGFDPAKAAITPAIGRKRGIRDPGRADLSSRQNNAIVRHLAELDRENHRDVQISIPVKQKDASGRGMPYTHTHILHSRNTLMLTYNPRHKRQSHLQRPPNPAISKDLPQLPRRRRSRSSAASIHPANPTTNLLHLLLAPSLHQQNHQTRLYISAQLNTPNSSTNTKARYLLAQ